VIIVYGGSGGARGAVECIVEARAVGECAEVY
jgi:hypothetical protein